MSKSSSSVSLIAVFAAGLALFSWLPLSCSKAPQEISDGDDSTDDPSAMGVIRTGSQERASQLSLLDFPPAADMPASPLVARPRRPVRLFAQTSPSTGVLSLIAGGTGAHRPQSPATVTYGVKLQLDLSANEDALKKSFLLGGDRGGADVVAMGLERFVALLPELIPARPRIFALVAYSRGGLRLVSQKATAIDELKNAIVAYVPDEGGRYFLNWRLLKEGVNPSEIFWLEAKTSSEALHAVTSGKAKAAIVQSVALGGIEEAALQAEGMADCSSGECQPCQANGADGVDEDKTEGKDAPQIQSKSAEGAPTVENTDDKAAEVSQRELPRMHHLASTADAPLLSPIVLVVRGDFSVRYPDILKRLTKAVIAEGALAIDAPLAASRRLREIYPNFEAPEILLTEEPMASLSENRAFFGLSREAYPVPFSELLRSMIRVLKSEGRLPNDLRGATPENLFLKTPLESISERAIASAKATSKAARQKGKIQDAPALTSPDSSTPSADQSDSDSAKATTSEAADPSKKTSDESGNTEVEQAINETCVPQDSDHQSAQTEASDTSP